MSAECGKCGADLVDWPLRCPECPWRELVEELAKEAPIDQDGYCGLCGESAGCFDRSDLHSPTCLWRRAVELVRS